jgi:hypothetical protein
MIVRDRLRAVYCCAAGRHLGSDTMRTKTHFALGDHLLQQRIGAEHEVVLNFRWHSSSANIRGFDPAIHVMQK